MRWIWPALGLGGVMVGLMAMGSSSSSSSSSSTTTTTGPGQWVDPDAPRRIRELAGRLEWPGLADFLVAVAYWESRGNPQAGKDEGNAARGWFGMRPLSARVSDLGLTGDALKNEAIAVALAAWYAWRLRGYAKPDQGVDWLAIRRGWRYPRLVSDISNSDEESIKVRRRFEQALYKAGVDESLMRQSAYQIDWPGIDRVLAEVQNA